jgi:hypothetical protein
MIENNLLDRTFGPVGSSTGIFLFITGLIMLFFSLGGLILVLIGAFLAFTSTNTLIDYEKRRIKFSNNLFGFIKTGHWINIEPEMKIGIKKSDSVWRAYSRTNRTLEIADKDFRIILYDSDHKEIMQIKKTDSLESAQLELAKMSARLGLNMVNSLS